MTNPYTSQSVSSSYNQSPPSDDGSTTAANRVNWSTIKTKLSDPLNTFAAAINSAVSSAFAKVINTDDLTLVTDFDTAADQFVGYDNSGSAYRVFPGTTFAPPEANVWNDISSGTISAAASQAITYTASDYRIVKIYLTDILPVTDNDTLNMRTSTNGGSSYDSGASDYQWSTLIHAHSVTFISSAGSGAGATSIVLSSGIGNATGEGWTGEITIFDPSTAVRKGVLFDGIQINPSGDANQIRGHGRRLAAADVDAIQFYFGGGNIASGRYHAVGLLL